MTGWILADQLRPDYDVNLIAAENSQEGLARHVKRHRPARMVTMCNLRKASDGREAGAGLSVR